MNEVEVTWSEERWIDVVQISVFCLGNLVRQQSHSTFSTFHPSTHHQKFHRSIKIFKESQKNHSDSSSPESHCFSFLNYSVLHTFTHSQVCVHSCRPDRGYLGGTASPSKAIFLFHFDIEQAHPSFLIDINDVISSWYVYVPTCISLRGFPLVARAISEFSFILLAYP